MWPKASRAALLACTALATSVVPTLAQDATWLTTPANGNYDSGANWDTGTVPTGTAFFDTSSITSLTTSGTSVGGWTLNPGASSYSITNNGSTSFSGAGITINGGSLGFTNNFIVQFNGSSTAGASTLTNNGFVFFQDSSTAGSATIGNQGAITFSSSSTAGNAAITSSFGALLSFTDTATAGNATITSNDSRTQFTGNSTGGTAAFDTNAGGIVDFSGSTGPAGDGKLTAGSLAGAGSYYLGANALTVGGNNASTTVSGVISDCGAGGVACNNAGAIGGSLVKTGGGTLTLTGLNTYTGGTTINGGTLALGDATHTGAIVGAVTNNDTFEVVNANTSGITSITNNGTTNFRNTSTAGNAAITNNASLNFYDASTAGNAAITTSSSLNFYDNSTAGSATITNNGGFVQFSGNSTAGNAMITQSGSFVQFHDNSTAANATITQSGSFVQFFDNSTAANATINQTGSFVHFFNNSTAGNATISETGSFVQFFDHSTGGNATLTDNGGGFIQFFNNSTGGNAAITSSSIVDFSGTSGALGDHKISAGSIAGSGQFLLGANELTVGGNGLSTTVSGIIGGSGGSLVKIGAGTLTLTGNGTYTGATTIDAGTLEVDGSITTSAVTVNSGGTLDGVGSVRSTTVNNGATLLPGTVGTLGTLTVNGNLTFGASANYVVFLTPSLTALTNVSGAATLGGTVFVTGASGQVYHPRSYTILTAAGGLGGTTFSALNVLGDFGSLVRNPHLAYDANDVFLVLDPATITLLSSFSRNQTQVATGINAGVLGGGTLPASFVTLLGYSGAQLTAALDQLDGQAATGAATGGIAMMNQFLALLLNPLGGAPGGNPGALGFARAFGPGDQMASPEAAEAYAAVTPKDRRADTFDRRWRLWGQGYGGYNNTAGDAVAGTNDVAAHIWGLAAGADYRVLPNTTLGFALAGGNLSWGLSGGLGGGKSDVFQLGAYGSHTFGAAYISAAGAYAWHDMTTDRTVTTVGIEMLHAGFRAQSLGGRLEGGYRFATPWLGITPYAAVQAQQFRTPSYSETVLSGTGTFPLSYASNRTTATRVELGSWFDKLFALRDGRALAIRARAAWAHDHTSDIAMNAVFQTLPGSNFTVNGAAMPANAALLSAGGELRFPNSWSLGAKFDGEFASHARTYAGTGSITYRW